jgi:hypothetical protein
MLRSDFHEQLTIFKMVNKTNKAAVRRPYDDISHLESQVASR